MPEVVTAHEDEPLPSSNVVRIERQSAAA